MPTTGQVIKAQGPHVVISAFLATTSGTSTVTSLSMAWGNILNATNSNPPAGSTVVVLELTNGTRVGIGVVPQL